MHITWDEEAWNDYVWWQFEDRKTLKRLSLIHIFFLVVVFFAAVLRVRLGAGPLARLSARSS